MGETMTATRPQAYPVLGVLDCGVILLDRQGRIAFWNPWMTRMSGIDLAHATGRRLDQVFPREQIATSLLDAVNDALTLGMSRLLSNQLHHHPLPLHRPLEDPGVLLDISVQVRPVESGALGCVLQINDVSAAVRRERRMREREADLRLHNSALEASSQGIIIAEAGLAGLPVQHANPAFTAITGLDGAALVGRDIDSVLMEITTGDGLGQIREALATRREVACDLPAKRADGQDCWLELLVSPVFDAVGRASHFVFFLRDITARRMAETLLERALSDVQATNARLDREQSFVSTVLRTIGALVVVVDRRLRVVTFNRACEQATGLAEDDMLGAAQADLRTSSDLETAVQTVLASGLAQTLETPLVGVGGDSRIVRWTLSPLQQTGAGTISHVVCAGTDITDRRRAEALLRGEREIMELISRDEDLGLIGDRACRLIEGQIGGAKASLMSLGEQNTLSVVAGPSLPPGYLAQLTAIPVGAGVGTCGRAAFTGEPVISPDLIRDPNWQDYLSLVEPFGLRACWSTPILGSSGMVLGTFAVYFLTERSPSEGELDLLRRAGDIMAIAIERRRTMDRIRHLALYDQLTGLANRSLLSDRLMTAIRQARRGQRQLALLFLDFDGFKAINDRCGHDAGDELLAVSGQRLRQTLRESDTPARIGGDEFVVLLPDISGVETAAYVAEKLLAVMQEPVRWLDQDLRVGVSIGIAIYPEHGQTADELLSHADDAMYAAKAAGKGRWVLFAGGQDRETGGKA